MTQKTNAQSKRFIKSARELGCTEDEKAFDQTLKKLGSTAPPDTVKARKKQKPKKPAK